MFDVTQSQLIQLAKIVLPKDSNGHWTQPIKFKATKGKKEMEVTVYFHIKASEVKGLPECVQEAK